LRFHEAIHTSLVPKYFRREYLPVIKNLPQTPITTENPETIWQFWGQGMDAAPDVVRACFAQVEKHRGDFKHVIITNDNVREYSDLPEFIYERLRGGKIQYAHFADLLRLNLLKNHGGFWMDATNYMTAEIPQWIIDQDFFIFHVHGKSFGKDVGLGSPFSFIQNCFIRAKKGDWLVRAWHDLCIEYWRREDHPADYFQHQLMFKALITYNKTARELYLEMPNVDQEPTHRFSQHRMLEPYDRAKWDKLTKDSFFQKLKYQFNDRTIPDDSYLGVLSRKGEL
jgi:hypothetical protein